VRGDAVPLGGALSVQQEAGVNPGIALRDRGPVGERQAAQERPDDVLRRGERGLHVDAGGDAEMVEGSGKYLSGGVARPGAEGAERAVDLGGAVLHREDGVGDAEGEVLVPVEADLGLVSDLRGERGDARLGVAEDERAGRVDDVDALRAAVHHDPGLLRQLGGPDPVRQHQESDCLHAHLPGSGEVLEGHVGLGAVGGDPGDRGAGIAGATQVLDRPDPGQQENGDLGVAGFVHRRGDQLDVVDGGEPVVERRAAEAVAVGDLDDLHAGRVQGVHDAADLPLGEPVSHRVAAVAERGVGDSDSLRSGHAVTFRLASCSPVRAAAAVMMSRLPAHGGR
jgi:hypothetical protein